MKIKRTRSLYKELLKEAYEESGLLDTGWMDRLKISLCQRELMLSPSSDIGDDYPSGEASRISSIVPRSLYVVWIPRLSYISAHNYRMRLSRCLSFAEKYPDGDYVGSLIRSLWLAGLHLSDARDTGDIYPQGYAHPLSIPKNGRSEIQYVNWRSFTNNALVERRIGCAAYRSKKGAIVSGLRHGSQDMRTSINLRADREDFIGVGGKDQGFIDSYGTYLDRHDAYKVALAAGQILEREKNHTGHSLRELFSEMIY